MSDDSAGLSANPMFGAIIGQQIANNRTSEMREQHLDEMRGSMAESNNASMGLALAAAALKVQNIQLNDKIYELEKEILDLEAFDQGANTALAGVRGVTRELLSELRKADPNNPLLEKKVRDKIFEALVTNQEKNQDKKLWKKREEEAPQYRDLAYGAPGSNKGGPEKSQINSSAEVRAEAGVPDHVTDRERFLGLIKVMHDELKKSNPNSPILKDSVMVDVFTEYALNEMDKQPTSGGGSKNGI